MRRSVLPLLFAALVLAACDPGPPPEATGLEIYRQSCASCHGDDLGGRIGPALGVGSPVADLGDDYLRDVITNGKGSRMPAFSRTLSEAQIQRLIDYIREEQGQ